MLRWVSWRYPNLGEVHYQLAITYRLDNQLCEARNSALEAARAEPDSWRYRDELAGIHVLLGDLDAARETYKAAAELAPPGSRARRNLFAVQVIAGDYDGAVQTSVALPRPISSASLAGNIATAYFFTGHLDEAQRYLELALSLADDDRTRVGLRQNLGDLMARRGLQEEAKEEYRKALDLLQKAPQIHTDTDTPLWRALLLAKIEDCYSATTVARQLEQSLPNSIDKHHVLAKTFALCGSRGEALAAVEQAIHLGALGKVMRLEDEFSSLADEPAFARLTALEPEIARCP